MQTYFYLSSSKFFTLFIFRHKIVCDFDALASSFHNMKLDIVSKLGFIFMFELIVFQSVCVKHYLSLSQWRINLHC